MVVDREDERELNLLMQTPDRRLGRRGFLRNAALLGVAGMAGYAGGTVAGIGRGGRGGGALSLPGNRRDERLLNIYNWPDYIDDQTIPAYQAHTNVRVNYDVCSSNEDLLAKMRAAPTQYDIIVPTNNFIPTYRSLGLIEPLHQDLIPNLTNLDKEFVQTDYDPGNRYTIPWQWGTTGIGYNKRRVPGGKVDSWAAVFAPPAAARGRISLLREFTDDTYIDELAAGETWLAQGWSGDAFQAQEQNPDVAYDIPREGSLRFVDVMCVPKGAPHPGNAARFMNYVLSPTVQARISKYVSYGTPVSLAKPLLPADQLSDPEIYPPSSTKLAIVTVSGQRQQKWQAAADAIIRR